MNSQSYESEKQHIISKIEESNNIIQQIIDNANLKIASSEQLETNEFEIAIVGLEKAGKSTFANALIDNIVKPLQNCNSRNY